MWTRNLSTDIALGPELITSSSQVCAPLQWRHRGGAVHIISDFDSIRLNFNRGTTAVEGYLFGAVGNTGLLKFQPEFGPELSLRPYRRIEGTGKI